MEKVIDITAKRDGFRRAGKVHSEQTQTYPLSEFTKAQLEQLQNEPMLVVAIRNKDDNSGQPAGGKVAELEQLLAQERETSSGLRLQLDGLADVARTKDLSAQLEKQLEDERQTVSKLTTELTTEREQSAAMATELEGERKKVTDLTAQLEAATKKGK